VKKKLKLTPEITEKIEQLADKFAASGQDLSDYLEGLLYNEYITYWDYIHLDILLNLQTPRTAFKDEMVFITYHQITELYFKLILWELEQLTGEEQMDADKFLNKINRLNRYFEQLTNSFSIMVDGLDRDEFLKFRMALLPSSGFQSAQFRMIEICATDLGNLLHHDYYLWLSPDADPTDEFVKYFYWKRGAIDVKTKEKTLTLKKFEEKYDQVFIDKAKEFKDKNLQRKMQPHIAEGAPEREEIIKALRKFDELVNIQWALAHFKAAVRHLHKKSQDTKATGGTNWKKYLPPRFQRVIFFPELWTEEEKENWGRSWVMKEVLAE